MRYKIHILRTRMVLCAVIILTFLLAHSFIGIGWAARVSVKPVVKTSKTPQVRVTPMPNQPAVPPNSLIIDQAGGKGTMTVKGNLVGSPFYPCEERVLLDLKAVINTSNLPNSESQTGRSPSLSIHTSSTAGAINAADDAAINSALEGKLWIEEAVNFSRDGRTFWTVKAKHPAWRLDTIYDDTILPIPINWDGVVRNGDKIVNVASGSISYSGTVSLIIQTSYDKGATVVDSKQIRGAVTVLPASQSCSAWVNLAPTYAGGANGKVIIHGQDSVLAPNISWQKGKATMVFGNLKPPTQGVDVMNPDTALFSLRAYLSSSGALFTNRGAPNLQNIERLRVAKSNNIPLVNRDPDNTIRAIFKQVIDETDSNGNAQSIFVKDSRLVGLFDDNGSLLLVSGRWADDLSSSIPPAQINVTEARGFLERDNTNIGLSGNRAIHFIDTVVWGKNTSEYTRAYHFVVGEGDQAEVAPKRFEIYDAYVSATDRTGRVLERKNTTAFSQADITVLKIIERPAPLPIDNLYEMNRVPSDEWPFSVDECDEDCPQTEVNPPDDGEYYLSDDDIGGVISEVEGPPNDEEPTWTTPSLTTPPAGTNSDSFWAATTAYEQIHRFWTTYAAPLLPANSWDFVDVTFENTINAVLSSPTPPNNYYQHSFLGLTDATIKLGGITDYFFSMTPSHEITHHLQYSLSDNSASGYNRINMSTALSEGIADFSKRTSVQIKPTYDYGAFLGLMVCPSQRNFFKCFKEFSIYRTMPAPLFECHYVEFYPPGFTHNSNNLRKGCLYGPRRLQPWPDCRISDTKRLSNDKPCYFIGRDKWYYYDLTNSVKQNDFFYPLVKYNSFYGFVAALLYDLWETGATNTVILNTNGGVEYTISNWFVDEFPHSVLKAYAILPQDPSFIDYRDALVISSALYGIVDLPQIVSSIKETFERHGVDADLEQYCTAQTTEEHCH